MAVDESLLLFPSSIRIQEGTPSYMNPLSALFLLRLLVFLFPAALTKIVRAVTINTMIAAIVGT